MIINTNLPCAAGELIDYLRDIHTGEEPHVRLLVLSPATRTDWDRDWPDSPPPFIYGYYYHASAD